MNLSVRRAEACDASALTAIAHAAKRHWGYPEAWVQRWRDALTLTPEYIAANACFVAADERGELLGFAALRQDAGEFWIDHVWVLPAAMGRGIGRRLFEQCEEAARRAGATRLKIEADPNAEAFYARMGAHTVGRVPSPMDGVERFLPIMAKSPPQRQTRDLGWTAAERR
jgi:GNAT superfamily N-acetyltransferase